MSGQRRSAALLVGFVAVAALTRAVVSGLDVINVDEASYMVGASELLHGRLPYTAFGDNKPPLIYVYYAAAQLVGGHGIDAVRLLTTLVTIPLTAFAVSAFYGHDRRGVIGAILFLLYSAAYTASDMLAVNCEPVMMLPLAWALVALRDQRDARRPERAFIAGLLIGVASLIKYQAGLWVPALALAVSVATWSEWRATLRVLCAMTIGLLLPLFATVTVFAVAGGLDGLLYWNVTHNFEYLQNPLHIGEALSRGAGRVLPFLAVTSVLWYGWLRSPAVAPSRYWEMLVAGVIGASAAAATLGLRFFPHYFIQLYVPLAIAAAPWAASVLVWPLRSPGWAVTAITTAAIAGWTTANAARLSTQTVPTLNGAATSVSERLKADACYTGSSMFVWGSAPEFYYHAGLPLATQFFFPEFPLVRYYAGNPTATAARARPGRRTRRVRHWSRLMADLHRSRPTYILDTAPSGIARWQYFPVSDYPMLHRLIQRQYSSMGSVNGVEIYRRIGCEGPAVAAGR
ncbi:MAG TPA: glycosyltransferase family 39 protein [Vicinamibacterales bacterium]|nr:glycosyltransferase family 39 protein [Vicinamibacterales bacterium]